MKYSDEQRLKKIAFYAPRLLDRIDKNQITREQLKNDEDLHWHAAYYDSPYQQFDERGGR